MRAVLKEAAQDQPAQVKATTERAATRIAPPAASWAALPAAPPMAPHEEQPEEKPPEKEPTRGAFHKPIKESTKEPIKVPAMEPLPDVGMHEDLLEVPGATEAPREQPFQQGSADDHPRRPQEPRDQGVCPLSGVGFPRPPWPPAQRPPRGRSHPGPADG